MRAHSKSAFGFLLLFLSAAASSRADVTLTLNKTHKPGVIALGAPITYVITLSNSGTLNNHITVTDTLPSGFVFVSATCTATLGATCPSGTLQPPIFGEFSIPTNGNITIEMTAYFTTIGSKINRVVASAKDDQGNPIPVGVANTSQDSVTVPSDPLPVDLKVEKCVGPDSACVSSNSAAFPADLRYAITVTNKEAQDVYLGGLLTVIDRLTNNSSIQVAYSLLSASCTPSPGAVCPDIPLTASGSLPAFNTVNLFQFRYNAQGGSTTNDSGFLPGHGSYKIELELRLSTTETCKRGAVTLRNEAFLSLSNGAQSLTDNDSNNNTSMPTMTSITGGLPPECPPPPASIPVTKSQTNPTGNAGLWNMPVTYRVRINNPANGTTLTNLQFTDRIFKAVGTPTFTATVTSGPSCVSGCTSLTNVTLLNPTVSSDFSVFNLWTATLPTLGPGQEAVIDYTVTYAPTCETDNRPDQITNQFLGPNMVAQTQTNLPETSLCNLDVKKTKLTAGPIVFGQPFEYEVVFSNLSSSPLAVGTVRDVLSIASNRYGSFTFDYSVSCAATAGTIVSLTPPVPNTITPLPGSRNVSGATASHRQFGWQGIRLIDEALSFGPDSTLTCKVIVTPKQPTDSNPFCQGAGNPQLINSAYMDVSRNYNDNDSQQPRFYSTQAADLPLCRNLIVSKTANTHDFGPGATVVYTITVENHGDDDVDSFTLTDVVQPPLVPVFVTPCAPASCIAGPTLTGNQVDVAYGPLQPDVPVSFNLTVTAPQAGGSYPNVAKGSFLPGGNFYFQGDAANFLQQEENIQVVTPTLTKAFDLTTIGPNGSATLVFVITNTNGDPQQNGISFSDTLSPGLLADTVVSNGCGGTVSISPDERTIAFAGGELGAGSHSCQIAVLVKATDVCGIHLNNRDNFSNVANLDVSSVNEQLEVAGAACSPSPDVDVSLITGWDEISHERLPRGAADDDWTVSVGGGPAQPALVVAPLPAAWPRLLRSGWISATASGASQPGAATVRFERCFCLAADAGNAKLMLRLWSDDRATVLLNGVPIAGPGGQFRRAQPLSVLHMGTVGSSLFQPGNNCVAIDVDDIRPLFVGLDVAGSVWVDHGKCDGVSY